MKRVQKRIREPWIEYILKAWAKWLAEFGRWQGQGAGVDNAALLAEVGWGRGRSPGTYSNPVLAEIMAMLYAKQGPHARLHAEILGLPDTERRAIVARYAGRLVPVPRMGMAEDRLKISIDVPLPEPADPEDRVKVKYRLRALRRMENPGRANVCWLDWELSGGPLPFAQVAQQLGLAPSTCHAAVERAKLRLQFRLEVRRSIALGQFAPDGGSLRKVNIENDEVPDAA